MYQQLKLSSEDTVKHVPVLFCMKKKCSNFKRGVPLVVPEISKNVIV